MFPWTRIQLVESHLVPALRFVGRRQLDQLTVIDLVIIILLGSAVGTAMVAGNTTLPAGIVSAGTLLIANRILSLICYRSRRLRGFVAGHRTLLVNRGQVVEENLRRGGVTHDDLMIAIRARGYCELTDIRYAILEADGGINVIPTEGKAAPRGHAANRIITHAVG
jgi:uncharacterized membrane protein YcaP (DUF421 family)